MLNTKHERNHWVYYINKKRDVKFCKKKTDI